MHGRRACRLVKEFNSSEKGQLNHFNENAGRRVGFPNNKKCSVAIREQAYAYLFHMFDVRFIVMTSNFMTTQVDLDYYGLDLKT
ncbi:hypothetical protein Q3G72_014547 [Acer saccharum]|nr:hypothetical protein Q3G72_014547 [Acer saccharum]